MEETKITKTEEEKGKELRDLIFDYEFYLDDRFFNNMVGINIDVAIDKIKNALRTKKKLTEEDYEEIYKDCDLIQEKKELKGFKTKGTK